MALVCLFNVRKDDLKIEFIEETEKVKTYAAVAEWLACGFGSAATR